MKDTIEEYYSSHGKKLYLYLLSLCGEPDTAEELTQEAFLQAMKSLNKYRGDCSVYTWLCGIGKNLWLREIKRRKRLSPTAPENLPEEADTAPTPDDMAELRDTKLSLMRQIHGLPETEKEIVLLRASGALSFREIGEIFGKTENWARVTFYRAKQKLNTTKGE